MKGVIHNILEAIVIDKYGADTWDEMLDRAGVEGVYTTIGSYTDDDFVALAEQYAVIAQGDLPTCLREIGRAMLPHLADRYPEAVEQHPGPIRMIHALNDVIHPEVIKLYPGAVVPVFRCHEVDSRHIVLEYESPRGLCSLAHGLMLGVGDRFDQPLDVEQSECRHVGDGRCLFRVSVVSDEDCSVARS